MQRLIHREMRKSAVFSVLKLRKSVENEGGENVERCVESRGATANARSKGREDRLL